MSSTDYADYTDCRRIARGRPSAGHQPDDPAQKNESPPPPRLILSRWVTRLGGAQRRARSAAVFIGEIREICGRILSADEPRVRLDGLTRRRRDTFFDPTDEMIEGFADRW
jgi:hypothetical protein